MSQELGEVDIDYRQIGREFPTTEANHGYYIRDYGYNSVLADHR
jgi:hypothetical protein